MQKQNHSFVYFFAWLIIGAFLGLIILLYRGDINIGIKQPNGGNDTLPATANTTQYKHSGFADAVMKAAPAVVSIETTIWKEQELTTKQTQKRLKAF